MSEARSELAEYVRKCLEVNEGIVMIGSLAALLGVTPWQARRAAIKCGYEIQSWGGIDYITDDNKPGVLE